MRMDESDLKRILVEQEFKKGKSLPEALKSLSRSKYRYLFQEPERVDKKSKLHSEIVHVDGVTFRSQLEADRYCYWRDLLRAGEIAGFCIQPKFILVEGREDVRCITYSADYIIFHNGKMAPAGTYQIEDTKGFETEAWKRTYKQFKLKFPQLELRVEK